jgi:hypothetical protein
MKILRGQGVARLVQQAASGLLVVVQVLGCWFSGSSASESSNSDEFADKACAIS